MLHMYTQCKMTSKPRKGLKPCLTFYPTYDWELAFHIYIERVHCLEVVSEQRKAGHLFPPQSSQLRQWNVWNVSECPQRLTDVATQHLSPSTIIIGKRFKVHRGLYRKEGKVLGHEIIYQNFVGIQKHF